MTNGRRIRPQLPLWICVNGGVVFYLGKLGSMVITLFPLTSTVLPGRRQLPCALPGLSSLSLSEDHTPGQRRRAPATLPQAHLLLQVPVLAHLRQSWEHGGPLGKLRHRILKT